MTDDRSLEDGSDWDALQKFRKLSDVERVEQMFMTALASSRTSRENGKHLQSIDKRVGIQNGRISKLEVRWIQGAAVIAFLLVVIPILLAAVSLVTR